MKSIDKVLEILITLAYGIVVAITFIGVFCRYVLNNSIVWGEELSRYLFIWIIFLGVPLGIERGAHISVDFLVGLFPQRMKSALIIIDNLLVGIFFVIIFVPSLTVVQVGMRNVSLSLGIPMGMVYLAFPVGWTLTILYLVRAIIRKSGSKNLG